MQFTSAVYHEDAEPVAIVKYRDLINALRELGLDGTQPAIAHGSLSAFVDVQGGADTIVGALIAATDGLIMPTFTYKTMVTPQFGPPNNGLTYGRGSRHNLNAEFYFPDMPADPLMGIIPETLRQLEEAERSKHPIYSFSGVNAKEILAAQSLQNPFGPIQKLTEMRGVVLLLGVNHTANTSIHYGEKFSGRRQFTRWALTPKGVRECPGWPGCSYGFESIAPYVEHFTKKTSLGEALLQVIPLSQLIEVVVERIVDNPAALLCNRMECERCKATRKEEQ
jgi:aminoglycoside 3-N-acetyltransferase